MAHLSPSLSKLCKNSNNVTSKQQRTTSRGDQHCGNVLDFREKPSYQTNSASHSAVWWLCCSNSSCSVSQSLQKNATMRSHDSAHNQLKSFSHSHICSKHQKAWSDKKRNWQGNITGLLSLRFVSIQNQSTYFKINSKTAAITRRLLINHSIKNKNHLPRTEPETAGKQNGWWCCCDSAHQMAGVWLGSVSVFTWHSRKPNYWVSLTMIGSLRCMYTPYSE